jgi:dTDP-4-dehydrorhamnose 3,5-epimerase
MRFTPLELSGAFVIDLEAAHDERGFFARSFCEREFAAHGLPVRFPQSNLSRNRRAGTLRGMHYAAAPHQEAKLVRCVRGALHDVIVDLRAGSPTRGRWTAVELDAEAGRALYIPTGFGHGFLTLRDETDVLYQMGEFFHAEAARGFRFDDPTFGVRWPAAPTVISPRDAGYPPFDWVRFDG